ncbi:hypothetical protein Goshw_001547, partial [Gossypium schwendimanii]|nr:hypothetical protein [Gossypium schwendimanii]
TFGNSFLDQSQELAAFTSLWTLSSSHHSIG